MIAALLAAAVASAGCGDDATSSAGAALDRVAAPSGRDALADVKAAEGKLLAGGPKEFDRWIRALRGHPIVVNQWASWCGPCRYEFPFFASQATDRDGTVAFIGIDSKDGRRAARSFLERNPVPFPHFFDDDATVARRIRGGRAWPSTAFYDRSGELVFTHQGSYATEAKLAADIERYALGG